jgi:hypothetical protein
MSECAAPTALDDICARSQPLRAGLICSAPTALGDTCAWVPRPYGLGDLQRRVRVTFRVRWQSQGRSVLGAQNRGPGCVCRLTGEAGGRLFGSETDGVVVTGTQDTASHLLNGEVGCRRL